MKKIIITLLVTLLAVTIARDVEVHFYNGGSCSADVSSDYFYSFQFDTCYREVNSQLLCSWQTVCLLQRLDYSAYVVCLQNQAQLTNNTVNLGSESFKLAEGNVIERFSGSVCGGVATSQDQLVDNCALNLCTFTRTQVLPEISNPQQDCETIYNNLEDGPLAGIVIGSVSFGWLTMLIASIAFCCLVLCCCLCFCFCLGFSAVTIFLFWRICFRAGGLSGKSDAPALFDRIKAAIYARRAAKDCSSESKL